jgi:2-polyprenyl-3-methyl-5-hydroxy-6-metoxy-1,4-benzoquinol methylase
LLQCDQCSFIFADASELQELSKLYGELVDEGYLESSETRRIQMRKMLARLQRIHPGRTLLDVGCAAGLLVEEAMSLGFEAVGVEPSHSLAEQAQQRGLPVLHGVLPCQELAGKRFDIVCLVDVIEHVADPVSLLKLSAEQMAPGGAMLVVTPDIGSVTAKLLGEKWWHLRVAHVGYFDRRTMARAAQAAGLRVASAFRPWWFFPASYLVERIRKYMPFPSWGQSLLGNVVVPLQLGDSWAFVLRKAV